MPEVKTCIYVPKRTLLTQSSPEMEEETMQANPLLLYRSDTPSMPIAWIRLCFPMNHSGHYKTHMFTGTEILWL